MSHTVSCVNVALAQLKASTDQQNNLQRGLQCCDQAAKAGADIVLFPEMWNCGESYNPRKPDWLKYAISVDDPFIKRFQQAARELDLAIVMTYLEAWNPAPRNTAILIDRHGDIVMTYAKVHTCDFDIKEVNLTPGTDFCVCALDTKKGPVKIGVMICYDREFPESARILMLKGAEIILVPNSCELDEQRIHQFQTRAFENMVGVAMANYARPHYNGRSTAYRADGTLIVEAGYKEGMYYAKFNLNDIREFRETEMRGNTFRRPQRYHDLIAMNVEKPFIRKNAFGKPFKREER